MFFFNNNSIFFCRSSKGNSPFAYLKMKEEQVTEGKKEIFFIFISDAVILFAYQEISAADWRLLMMLRVKCFASLHAFFFLTLCARESYIRKLIYVGVFACVCVCASVSSCPPGR